MQASQKFANWLHCFTHSPEQLSPFYLSRFARLRHGRLLAPPPKILGLPANCFSAAGLAVSLLRRLRASYKFHNIAVLPSVACSSYFPSALFSFQGANFQPLSRSDRNICLQVLRSGFESLWKLSLLPFFLERKEVVEIIGLEPMTPCLQSRCSPS